jgi:hypothetical protein
MGMFLRFSSRVLLSFKCLFLCSILIVTHSFLTSSSLKAASLSFSYDEVNELVGDALQGLEIRLNNLGRFNGRNHHRKNSSYVRFKGKSISSFSVEPYNVYKLFGRTHSYYVTDIKSSVIDVTAQDRSFYLSLDFELDGAELEGRCVTKVARKKYKECNSFLPNVNFTQAKVLARLRPIAHKGSMSFYISSAKIVGDINIEYCNSWFLGFFCTEFVQIPDKTEKLKKQIASKLKVFVNSQRMRDQIANNIREKVLGNLATVSSIKLTDDEIIVKGRLKRRRR